MVSAKGMTDNERKFFSKSIAFITWMSVWIGIVSMASIVLVVFVDVCGRYLLNMPVPIAYDLVEQSLVVLAGFSIALASLDRIHPAIDLITAKFPCGVQTVMDKTYSLLGFASCMVLTYALWGIALNELKIKSTLVILKMSPAPFIFLLAIGLFLCGLTCLILVFLPSGEDTDKKQEERYDE
jgi:TRAP-type C4-dicarboxylate transport system permease small subunit